MGMGTGKTFAVEEVIIRVRKTLNTWFWRLQACSEWDLEVNYSNTEYLSAVDHDHIVDYLLKYVSQLV